MSTWECSLTPTTDQPSNAAGDAGEEVPPDFLKTTITTPGNEPRVSFQRKAPAAGEKARYTFVFKQGKKSGLEIADDPLEVIEFAFDLTLEVTRITDDEVEYAVHVDDARLKQPDGLPPAIKASMKDQVLEQRNKVYRWNIPLIAGRKTAQPPQSLEGPLEILWEVLPNVPREPLGNGAQWTHNVADAFEASAHENAKQVILSAESSLKSEADGTWTVTDVQSVKGDNITESDGKVVSVDTRQTSTFRTRCEAVLPVTMHSTVKTRITATTKVGIPYQIREEVELDFRPMSEPPAGK